MSLLVCENIVKEFGSEDNRIAVLKGVSLSLEKGEAATILGSSGAGKSTFVNAVTGYEKAKATITEGGVDYYNQYDQVKHRIGFVPQENLMREEDTVELFLHHFQSISSKKNPSKSY